MKKWNYIVILALAALLMSGCESVENVFGVHGEGQMQNYAEARYLKALRYMKESRFELAKEQFAIAAATAVSPELQGLARAGYVKVDKAMAVQR